MANELDALDPQPEIVTLQSGLRVRVVDLKTKQFFKLFRVITHGMANGGFNLEFPDPNDPLEAFIGRMLFLVGVSIGDAGDEAVDFLRAMIVPADLQIPPNGKVNKQQSEFNRGLWNQLDIEMDNPEPEDTIDLLETIVRREAEDMQALGKRVMAMFKVFQRTGQTESPSPQTSTESNSSEVSAEPSTLFNLPTDGQTRNVESLPSDAFDRLSPPLMSSAITTTG